LRYLIISEVAWMKRSGIRGDRSHGIPVFRYAPYGLLANSSEDRKGGSKQG
jgi:hypothetical protein